MLKAAIKKLVDRQDLTQEEISKIMDFIIEGKALSSEIAAFLTALAMKGETSEEITGFAIKMRDKALKINLTYIDPLVDSCGTGGDFSNTFNISTASAILAASSGLNVAKHSNFGFTSKCGSSNVIESLGIPLVKTSEELEQNLRKNNIVFIHAPYFHKCISFVNPVRKEIGIRTIFNFLGPLSNPTNPTGQILGVSNPALCQKMIETLKNLGCKKALVVNGQSPLLDEISICGKTLVYKLENNMIEHFEIHPEDFGIKKASIEEIAGDSPQVNAKIIENIFAGNITGPKLDAVILNSAALLWAGNKVDSIENGIKTAYNLVEQGKAKAKLQELKHT